MTSKKRTKKIFVDYNEYIDRPFGLKWGTAFAMDELVQVINKNKRIALKENKRLPQMSREEIDQILVTAFVKCRYVSIQTSEKDGNGNLLDNIEGVFEGYFDTENLYLREEKVRWDSIINIYLKFF